MISHRVSTPETSGEPSASPARVGSCSRDVTGTSPSQVSGTAGRRQRSARVTSVSPIGTARPTSPEMSPRTSPPPLSGGVTASPAPVGSRRRPGAPGGLPVRRRRGGGTSIAAVLARHRRDGQALGSYTRAGERSRACGLVGGLGGRTGEWIVGRGDWGRWAGRGDGRDEEGREGGGIGRDGGWREDAIGRVQAVAKRSVDTCHPFGEAASAPAAPPPAGPDRRWSPRVEP